MRDPIRWKFNEQRSAARKRGVEWVMSFDEWWSIWQSSGQWANRGCRRGQYVMARRGDVGAYEFGNVEIVRHEANVAEGNRTRHRTVAA